MLKRLLIGLAVVLALGLSSPALATPSAFTGTVQFTLEGASLGSMVFGGTADVSLVTGTIDLPVVTATTLDNADLWTHPRYFGASVGATMSADGTLTSSGGPNGSFGGNVPVFVEYIGAVYSVPGEGYYASFNLGTVGLQGATVSGVSSSRRHTLSWNSFYANRVVFTVTASGWGTSTISYTIDGRNYTATGADDRTANRGGQIVLITPIRIWGGIPNGGAGGFATMTLNFAPVPEPGTALLLGSGLLGLAVVGRRQR